MENKKLYRSIDDYMLGGVCGGVAKYFSIDSSLVRIIFALMILSGGMGFLLYVILWLVVPKEEGEEKIIDREEKIEELAKDIKKRAKTMASEIKFDVKVDKKKKEKKINVLGLAMILIGGVAIWNQVAPFVIDWEIFFPLLLVMIGAVILFK
jgi:phage shock protein PspC (stress-responsive transcriptional regulator)